METNPSTVKFTEERRGPASINYMFHIPCIDVTHEYTTLPSKKSHIRLLMMCGGSTIPLALSERAERDPSPVGKMSDAESEPLNAIFFTNPLSELKAQYIALSYTWGTEKPTKIIRTTTGLLYVSSIVDAALRRILDVSGPGICVWVDSISIDQGNNVEKAGQIRLMSSIFASASYVAAYLGTEDVDSADAVKLMRRFGEVNLDDENMRPRNFDDFERCRLPAFHDKMWVALQRFVARPWFRRVWIVQECVVAKEAVLFWGSNWFLPFQALRILVVQFAKLGIPVLDVDRTTATVSPVPGEAVIKGWNGLLGLVRLQRQWQRGEREDLFSLLDAFRDAEATLTRDKYFALVGLSNAADDLHEDPDLRPDYQEAFANVSIRYTRYFLKSRGMKEAIRILSLAQPRYPDLALPSWVPAWDKSLESTTLTGLHPHPIRDQLYRTAASSPPYIKIGATGNSHTLVIHGVAFQHVAFVGHDHWAKYRHEHIETTVLMLMLDVRMFGQLIGAYPTGELVKDVLWKTLTLNQYSNTVSMIGGFLTGLPHDHIMASVSAARKFFERATDFGNNPATRDFATVQNFNAAKVAFGVIGGTLRGWKFAILTGGYVGMVPITAQKSDLIVIISGARTPYVVRNMAGTWDPIRYRLVGECYIHGIMQGEIFDNGMSLDWEDLHLV